MPLYSSTRFCENCGVAFAVGPFRRFLKINPGRFCSRSCYQAWRLTQPPIPLTVRFWKHVDTTGSCWVWTAARTNGYGAIGTTPGRTEPAHRVSWEIHYGPIPRGMHVLHQCDNRACVRPDHLFLGTNADNIADRVEKRRRGGGVRKLTADDVREIRRLAAEGVPQAQLVKTFGVAPSVISQIVTWKAWKHVT